MEEKTIDVIGFGSPILDLLVEVEDYFLEELELTKGEMTLTTSERAIEIINQLQNHDVREVAGGSCANTIYGVAYLGGKSAFCGVIGDDEHGKTYELSLTHENIKHTLNKSDSKTGHAITLVTKDGQRTFATHLGAAIHFKSHHVIEEDIKHSKVLHLEAYQIEGEDTYRAMLQAIEFAKKYNTKVSMDLSDPGLVDRNREKITELIKEHIDIVFANEEEARMFTKENPRDSLDILANYCEIAIVKLGENGSLIKSNPEVIEIKAHKTNALDTTGAGDMYAAGFLYAITNGKSLREAGEIASKHATQVVTQIGARLS